jgi:hypothetical protein
MKQTSRSIQHHDLYRKYHGQGSKIKDLLGEYGSKNIATVDRQSPCVQLIPQASQREFSPTAALPASRVKEMMQKIFNTNKKKKDPSKSQDDLPDSEFPLEFIEFINQRKAKSNDATKEEPEKVPEID